MLLYIRTIVSLILYENKEYKVPYGTKPFGGRKLWWIAANKHFGGQNIGGLTTLHCKMARIKVFGGLVVNRQICHQTFLSLKFCASAIWYLSRWPNASAKLGHSQNHLAISIF